jgi:hypothetical protein
MITCRRTASHVVVACFDPTVPSAAEGSQSAASDRALQNRPGGSGRAHGRRTSCPSSISSLEEAEVLEDRWMSVGSAAKTVERGA